MTAPAVKAQYRCHEEKSILKPRLPNHPPWAYSFAFTSPAQSASTGAAIAGAASASALSASALPAGADLPATELSQPLPLPAPRPRQRQGPAGLTGTPSTRAASPRATPQRCHVAEPGRWAWQGEVVRGLRIVETEDLRFLRRAIAAERWRIAAPMAIIQPNLLLPAC